MQTADPSIVATNGIAGWPQATDISSTAAVVMETSTNTVLYSKNADQALYPASAVKKSSGLSASFMPIARAILTNCPSQACRSMKKR